MNEKIASILQKAGQERKRAQFGKSLKRLEQGIAAFPDELDLYLEAIDVALDGGELLPATNLLKTVQDRFTRDRDRVLQFVREKVETNHDAALARCVIEHAVKRRDLDGALVLLEKVPDHTVRELATRARTKAQSLKSASHGGYTVRGEAVSNEITSMVLSVRLGNLSEAMASAVKLVEERPVEQNAMVAFLTGLAGKHPKSGRVRHAIGCAHRAGGHDAEAIQDFLEASRIEPACAVACAEQLRAMLETSPQPGPARRALAETLLIKGDREDAALLLREYLADNPESARDVVTLLRPFIDLTAPGACAWLAAGLALGNEQSALALEILRALHDRADEDGRVWSWLEERAADGPLPPDVMLFHGSLALERAELERAAEILSDVCSSSATDIPAVLSMIEKYRPSHAAIDVLFAKYAPKEEPAASPSRGDDDGFQTFEPNEFRLEGMAAPTAPATAAAKPAPRFNSSPFSSSARDGSRAAPAGKPMIETHEISFDDDGSLQRTGEDEPVPATATAIAIEITEEHVTNVAQQLYLAGAAVFFHIDDAGAGDASGAAVEAPAVEPEAAPPVAAEADETPASFEDRYARFQRGDLSNAAVLEMLGEAVLEGRVDELHELLGFEPQTTEEHAERYYFQAEYHLLCNRPLQALEILAKLDTPGLDDETTARIWYRIVVAQRMTHNYAGAAATLERLLERFPGRDDLIRLKRRNHEQFIESQSLAATTLEKTSTLD